MAKQQETPGRRGDEVLQIVGEIAEKSQRLIHSYAERRCSGNGTQSTDPLNLGPTIFELTARMLADPATMVQAQWSLWQDYVRLWQNTGQRLLGQAPSPLVEPERGDRRFRDPAWDDHAVFDFIKQSYLLASR